MGIVVIGDVFIDIKGFSTSPYIPYGRNAGTIAQIHGGVGRNVAEDIANVELEPTFVSSVDDDAMGEDVIRKLDRHKVNTKYMKKVKNGMGTWLAVFDHEGDVVASISKRPDHKPIEQKTSQHTITTKEFIRNHLIDTGCKWSRKDCIFQVACWNINLIFDIF